MTEMMEMISSISQPVVTSFQPQCLGRYLGSLGSRTFPHQTSKPPCNVSPWCQTWALSTSTGTGSERTGSPKKNTAARVDLASG